MPTKSTTRTTGIELAHSTPPLNSVQLDLLKLFERPLTAQQLREIKQLLSNYLADQVDESGKQIWQDKGLTATDMDKILRSHLRTPNANDGPVAT